MVDLEPTCLRQLSRDSNRSQHLLLTRIKPISASLFLTHIKPIKPRSQDQREIKFELRKKKFELKVWPCGLKLEKKLLALMFWYHVRGFIFDLFVFNFLLNLIWNYIYFLKITDKCFWILNFLGLCSCLFFLKTKLDVFIFLFIYVFSFFFHLPKLHK